MKQFKYMFITNNADIASYIEDLGVDRVFVDLEIDGKFERQGHLDTVISQHSVSDVESISKVLNKAELLVRINPFSNKSRQEIDSVIASGADIIMLPMFKTLEEVKSVGAIINKRVKFMPLVETVEAAKIISEVDELEEVDELHIGLNDLHLQLKLKFMFELLTNGYVENLIKQVSKPCGFGGIARVGYGSIPAENVMSEHVRLDSAGAILSRAFHNGGKTVQEFDNNFNFGEELNKLKEIREMLLQTTPQILKNNQFQFNTLVNDFIKESK